MSNDKVARATAQRLKTIREKTARGLFNRKLPRPTKIVQDERKKKGLETINDVYGGVPNIHDFKDLKPLYQNSDDTLMIHFPSKGAHQTAWWRIPHVKVGLPSPGDVIELTNTESDETRTIQVIGAPIAEWRKSKLSVRSCTGQIVVKIL